MQQEYDELIQKSKIMKEDDSVYIFPCFRYTSVFYRKGNYQRHAPYHQEISGPNGLRDIEEALINPDCITEYAEKNKLGVAVKKTEVFYRKIAKRKTFQGKPVLDHWKVIIVWNEHQKQWEVATAFIRSSPPYAMINTRIEAVVYKRDEQK